MFSPFDHSIIKQAKEKNKVEINLIDFRKFSTNKHNKVDDYPYGGGSGMVLTCQPIFDCIRSIENYENATKIIMSPQGKPLKQSFSSSMSEHEHLIILCGHYEGYDERIRTLFDYEVSIGDYVLTSGEISAIVLVDSIVRLLDGVIKADSHVQDSFTDGLLDYPHYTRPSVFEGLEVPEVLLSGNHKNIENWRKEQSISTTRKKRPDLFESYKNK